MTDVKFADHIHVDPHPVVITSNAPPYELVSSEKGAFLERAIELQFRVGQEQCISRNRAKQARAWKYLCDCACERWPTSSEKSQEEYELIF